jgi:hypothetical protein
VKIYDNLLACVFGLLFLNLDPIHRIKHTIEHTIIMMKAKNAIIPSALDEPYLQKELLFCEKVFCVLYCNIIQTFLCDYNSIDNRLNHNNRYDHLEIHLMDIEMYQIWFH